MTRPLWRMVQPARAGDVASRDRYESPEAGVSSYVARDEPPELLAAAVDGACRECQVPLPRKRRVQPLSLEWPEGEPAGTGDFIWPVGTYPPVVSRGIAGELRERFAGFEPGPVAEYPDLAELWVTASRRPHQRSTLREVNPPCRVCGTSILMWAGGTAFEVVAKGRRGLVLLEDVEWWEEGNWDPAINELARTHRPRKPGRGLFVAAETLDGADVFYIGDDNKAIICTDEVKTFVEQRGWTNVGFLAAGELVWICRLASIDTRQADALDCFGPGSRNVVISAMRSPRSVSTLSACARWSPYGGSACNGRTRVGRSRRRASSASGIRSTSGRRAGSGRPLRGRDTTSVVAAS